VDRRDETASDAELLRRSRSDAEAFRVVYDRHAPVVHAWLAARTTSDDIALDLTAETFAEAFRVAHRFRPGTSDARPWLIGIAANLLRVAWRSRRVETRARQRLGVLEATRIAIGDASDDTIDRLDSARSSREIESALAELSASQRTAVELRVTRDLPYAEIARTLGCSPGAARVLVFRGLRHLSRLLGEADANPR
jgi:RNA polymerase sigma factor (sigma-70 family)